MDWIHITSTIDNLKTMEKIKYIQDLKLASLVGSNKSHDPKQVIYNFSDYTLTPIEEELLMKGLNFALPPKKLDYSGFLLPFELLYRGIYRDDKIRKENLIQLKAKIKDVGLSFYRNYNSKDHRFENITEDEYNAFTTLSANKSIIIQKADKGNTVVIINKSDYIEKMEMLLSDTTKFKKVQFNEDYPVNKELRHLLDMEETITEVLDGLLSTQYINEEDYKRLKPCGSNPGVMYGLCKVHKSKVGRTPPFRPILSAIGTATYNLAKFLVAFIGNACLSKYCLKDSFSFSQEIQKQDSTLFMASLDVESLFTNIPLDETVQICARTVFKKKRKVNGLLKRHFVELLQLATMQSCFLFNERFYQQIDGVAMGSPLGPTLANMFMSYHEDIWLDNCPEQFRPVYYRRYIDDIIVLFKHESHLSQFKEYLNSQHQNIKFTSEKEEGDIMPFLDVLIKRENGSFTTSVYRKQTFSGVYTNFNSFLDKSYKLGLVFTLLHRSYVICSSYTSFHLEICKLKDILLKNAYPLFIIDKCIEKFLLKVYNKSTEKVDNEEKQEVTVSLPYLGKLSVDIKKSLVNIFKSTAPHLKLRVIFVSNIRLKNCFSFKDRISDDLQSLILYMYTCDSCKAVYPGKSKRHYKVRLNEHLGMSYKTEKPYKYVASTATAVRRHCHDSNHTGHRDSFKIIGRARNDFHLKIKESILLYRTGDCLNTAERSIPLQLFTK